MVVLFWFYLVKETSPNVLKFQASTACWCESGLMNCLWFWNHDKVKACSQSIHRCLEPDCTKWSSCVTAWLLLAEAWYWVERSIQHEASSKVVSANDHLYRKEKTGEYWGNPNLLQSEGTSRLEKCCDSHVFFNDNIMCTMLGTFGQLLQVTWLWPTVETQAHPYRPTPLRNFQLWTGLKTCGMDLRRVNDKLNPTTVQHDIQLQYCTRIHIVYEIWRAWVCLDAAFGSASDSDPLSLKNLRHPGSATFRFVSEQRQKLAVKIVL